MKLLLDLIIAIFDICRGFVAVVFLAIALWFSTKFLAEGSGHWLGYIGCAMAGIIAFLLYPKQRGRKKKRKNAPKYETISDLADAVESGEVHIDASIKAVLQDIRDTIEGISDCTEDEEVIENLNDLSFDLTRAVGDEPSSFEESAMQQKKDC